LIIECQINLIDDPNTYDPVCSLATWPSSGRQSLHASLLGQTDIGGSTRAPVLNTGSPSSGKRPTYDTNDTISTYFLFYPCLVIQYISITRII